MPAVAREHGPLGRHGSAPRTVTLRAILVFVSPAATLVEALEPLRSDPSHAAVLLDIDGTLAPIVRHADDAHVPEATRTLLIEISKRYGVVGCVSGRRAHAARQIVAIGSIAYIGNHGGELLRPAATHVELNPEVEAWGERVRAFAARAFTSEHQRLRVRTEDKQAIAAFHWRGAPDEEAARLPWSEIAGARQEEGFAVHWGRKVLEVRPPVTLHKGMGVTALLSAPSSDGPGTGICSVRLCMWAMTPPTSTPSARCASWSTPSCCAAPCARPSAPRRLLRSWCARLT